MKNTIIAVVVLLILGIGGFFFWKSIQQADLIVVNTTPTTTPVVAPSTPPATTTKTATSVDKTKTVLGTSVGGRSIPKKGNPTRLKNVLDSLPAQIVNVNALYFAFNAIQC